MADSAKLDFIIGQLNELKVLHARSGLNSFRDEVKVWKQSVDESLKQVESNVENADKEIRDLKTECDMLKNRNVPTYSAFATVRDDMYIENLKERIKS